MAVNDDVRNTVWEWINSGQASQDRSWFERNLVNNDQFYNQLYNEWANPWKRRVAQQQLDAQRAAEEQRIAGYQNQLNALNSQFQGTLSGLAHQYDRTQVNNQNEWQSRLAEIQNQYQQQLAQYQQQSNQTLGSLRDRITQLSRPKMVGLNFGYTGQNPDTNYQGWQRQVDSISELYNRGSGLLSKFAPDQASTYNNQFQGLLSGFRNASQAMYNYDKSNYDKYSIANTYQVPENEVANRWAEYAGFQQGLNQQRQGVLSQLSQLSDLAQNAYATGMQLEGQAKQNQLTYRNSWFANQASREAGMAGARSERMQARAVNQRRTDISRASNPYGFLSSQQVTR